jgi:tetratricopeptide (TPR) repeat protein
MLLGQLGVLHTQVGNYRIALGYLEERDGLPYEDGPEGLGVRLALARALLHVGRAGDAATAADKAVAMVDRTPSLEAYRTLAVDRDAVCNLAAGRFAQALALYDAQIPRLDAATGPAAARNRFVGRVGRAAAAVGAGQPAVALGDLAEVERGLDDPAQVARLRWAHGPVEHVVRTYKLISAGLRAKAYRQLLRLDDEARAIAARRAILQQRFVATRRTEYERAAMLAEAQLALSASDRGDTVGAGDWLKEAFVHADDLRARAHGELDAGQLDVLWLAARLSASKGAPAVGDLAQRLQAASDAVRASRDPALRGYQRWFEVYLPLVATPR